MFSFEKACEKMYRYCKLWNFPGIGSIGDVGNEWAFLPAPEIKGADLPVGVLPCFVNKDTGETRNMVFDVPDLLLIKDAKRIEVPEKYQPVY